MIEVEVLVEIEAQSFEVDMSDILGRCDHCNEALKPLEEDLGTCEACFWDTWTWRLASGTNT